MTDRIGIATAATNPQTRHPLVTAMLAVVFLGEPVKLVLVLGVVVIGVGVWLITTDRVIAPAAVTAQVW